MASLDNSNQRTGLWLGLFAVAMVGFGYALVPIYRVFCDVTGFGGRAVASARTISAVSPGSSRVVKVELDTNVNGDLPWRFWTNQQIITAHTGEPNSAVFFVANDTEQEIYGQAVHSFAPSEASLYVIKTECFCFTEQKLMPGEVKAMPVRFIVNSKLPEYIQSIVLSYTFFQIAAPKTTTAHVSVSAPAAWAKPRLNYTENKEERSL